MNFFITKDLSQVFFDAVEMAEYIRTVQSSHIT